MYKLKKKYIYIVLQSFGQSALSHFVFRGQMQVLDFRFLISKVTSEILICSGGLYQPFVLMCPQEIAAILISFQRHGDWQSREVKVRPRSGSMLLYSRKKVRYRRDGYCWKKRKDGKTTREDHMKLKVVNTL